jgi:putative ABC transport system substrate-binding protein
MMMTRAVLAVALTVGILALPLASEAQQATRVPRIGVLGSHDVPFWQSFRDGLRELGYVEGSTVALEYRWAGETEERFSALASELVRLRVDAIVTWGTPAALAARAATGTIPIVMAASGDPLGTGLITSLARPGANVTGSSSLNLELEGKRLELLREIVPKLSRVAVLWNPANPVHGRLLDSTKAAAASLAVQLDLVPVQSAADLDGAFAMIDTARPHALIVLSDNFFVLERTRIADFTAKIRLPAVYAVSVFADVGGLIVYGVNYHALFRRAASYVDRILKGTKPAELPVEQARIFELLINLRTARALGLKIPPSLLLRADRIIE